MEKHFPFYKEKKVEMFLSPFIENMIIYTDMDTIYVKFGERTKLYDFFEKHVVKYWEGTAEEILIDCFTYLLYHETYHGIKAPISKKDSIFISEAIFNGLKTNNDNSYLTRDFVYEMTNQTKNTICDFIVDSTFYIDNLELKYMQRQDIIPVYDYLTIKNKKIEQKPSLNKDSIFHFMYGALFGNENIYPVFRNSISDEGVQMASLTLEKILNEEQEINLDWNENQQNYSSWHKPLQTTIEKMTKNFSEGLPRQTDENYNSLESKRYQSITRLVNTLTPYLPLSQTPY